MSTIKNVALPNGAIYEIEDAVAREAIRSLHSFNVQIVQSLPITDIDDHTIYFVPASDGAGDDVYDEYMYINNQWEKVGNTRIDLSGYATEEYVDTAIGEIPLPEQSDWNEDDTTDPAYVLNRPAIRAGDGENSIVENEIETVYSSSHWELTGAAGSTIYTTTGSFDWGNVGTIIQYNDVITYVKEFDNSVLPAKITLAKTLSATDALNNTRVNIITNNLAYGKNANAENRSVAYGTSSHAENAGCANGGFSHAEGSGKTTGTYSHSEGSGSISEGANAHAENYRTTARGKNSHAEGEYTLANHKSQHVFGEYNATDPSTAAATARGDYVEIVGNGTAVNSRSNARTLDWSGNEVLAGKLTVGEGPTNNMDVATKQYVDENAGGDGALSILSNVITLTNASGQTSSINLPVYSGSVSAVGGGS